MDYRGILVLALVVVAVNLASAEKKRRSVGYPLDLYEAGANEFDVAEDMDLSEVNERDLRDLLETREEQKRGVFSCAKLFQKCHYLKHCCGSLRCKGRGFLKKGMCLKY